MSERVAMAVERRQLLLGAGLVVAVAVAIFARSGPDTRPPAAPARAEAPARGTAPADDAPPPAVHLETLRAERAEPVDQGRNPFHFRAAPPPLAARPPQSVAQPGDMAAGGQMPSVPAGPPPPPPITLKFIGIVEKPDGTRIAVLTDGKRPISGKEGDTIEGRYTILKIGTESLEIAYLDGRGRRTLPLSGQ